MYFAVHSAPQQSPALNLTKILQPIRASITPKNKNFGAGNEARTRDLNLGKVALYQLSYSRKTGVIVTA